MQSGHECITFRAFAFVTRRWREPFPRGGRIAFRTGKGLPLVPLATFRVRLAAFQTHDRTAVTSDVLCDAVVPDALACHRFGPSVTPRESSSRIAAASSAPGRILPRLSPVPYSISRQSLPLRCATVTEPKSDDGVKWRMAEVLKTLDQIGAALKENHCPDIARHFFRCRHCGQVFDLRSLRETAYHNAPSHSPMTVAQLEDLSG